MIAQTEVVHLTTRDRQAINSFVAKLYSRFDGQVLSVFLFGSRARGDAQSDSDVDMAVIVARDDPETRKAIRHLAVEVWLEYGLYLSTRVWSQGHWQRLKDLQTGLYRNLEREGVELSSGMI